LQKLGLDQIIHAMDQIRTTSIPKEFYNTSQVPCRIQVVTTEKYAADWKEEVALRFIKFVHSTRTNNVCHSIHPISLIVNMNGTIHAKPVHVVVPANALPGFYPARYRIPMFTISKLSLEKQIWRAEMFALGTLLYELFTGHRIFKGLSDEMIQNHYCEADQFPEIDNLPVHVQCLIYACWSAEFGCYITLNKFMRYVKDNPAQFTLQVTGTVASTMAFITVPVLGVIGFSAIGLAAGMVAAAWQSSISLVNVGSLFALCQSTEMGGAAAAGLTSVSARAGVIAIVASGLPRFPVSSLRGIFKRQFHQVP
jgi:hypothetical protein